MLIARIFTANSTTPATAPAELSRQISAVTLPTVKTTKALSIIFIAVPLEFVIALRLPRTERKSLIYGTIENKRNTATQISAINTKELELLLRMESITTPKIAKTAIFITSFKTTSSMKAHPLMNSAPAEAS